MPFEPSAKMPESARKIRGKLSESARAVISLSPREIALTFFDWAKVMLEMMKIKPITQIVRVKYLFIYFPRHDHISFAVSRITELKIEKDRETTFVIIDLFDLVETRTMP